MKTLLCWMVRMYQIFISPLLHALAGPLGGCRFRPTCSQYYIDAVQHHGAFKGSRLGIYRILRCNPWGGDGYDPVPGTEDLAQQKTQDSQNDKTKSETNLQKKCGCSVDHQHLSND